MNNSKINESGKELAARQIEEVRKVIGGDHVRAMEFSAAIIRMGIILMSVREEDRKLLLKQLIELEEFQCFHDNESSTNFTT